MTHIRAVVRKSNRRVLHLQGMPTPDGVRVSRLPDPVMVEVIEDCGAFYLLRLDGEGKSISDTWHETLSEAKEQASFEFEIDHSDWEVVKEG